MAVKNPMNAFAKSDSERPAKKSLMDNQDTKHKGDSGADDRKMITFYVSAEKHAALKSYCRQQGRTMTRVLQNAVDDLIEDANL